MTTECPHENKEPRLRGSAVYLQCLDCWQSVGGAIKKTTFSPDVLGAMPLFDQQKMNAGYRDTATELKLEYDERMKQKEQDRREQYESYMCSQAWAFKRAKVLRRDNYECQACLDAKATDVHHVSYEHFGDEPLFELESVCHPCHERIHRRPF